MKQKNPRRAVSYSRRARPCVGGRVQEQEVQGNVGTLYSFCSVCCDPTLNKESLVFKIRIGGGRNARRGDGTRTGVLQASYDRGLNGR